MTDLRAIALRYLRGGARSLQVVARLRDDHGIPSSEALAIVRRAETQIEKERLAREEAQHA